jgi:hypothetical protein
MEFLPPGQSFRTAFYPGGEAAGNKAVGGFFRIRGTVYGVTWSC